MKESLYNGFAARVSELSQSFPDVTVEHVGIGVTSAGVALLLAYIEKAWWPGVKRRYAAWKFARDEYTRKAMRTKEAMEKREAMLRDIVGQMISDGLLEKEFTGEISWQELRRLCKDISQRLNMPDLVPAKVRADTVKQEIKARLHGVETFYKNGIACRRPLYSKTREEFTEILAELKARRQTPPPLPQEQVVVKPAYSTSKYWKPKPVAA